MSISEMTNTEWLRSRLLAGVSTNKFSPDQAWKSYEEFFGPDGVLAEVVRHAKTRKLMGAFRYEQVESDGLSYDEKARQGKAKTYIKRAQEKLDLYNETGNREYLADIFNYVLLEWRRPYHPNAHFESTEREEL